MLPVASIWPSRATSRDIKAGRGPRGIGGGVVADLEVGSIEIRSICRK